MARIQVPFALCKFQIPPYDLSDPNLTPILNHPEIAGDQTCHKELRNPCLLPLASMTPTYAAHDMGLHGLGLQ